MSFQGIPAEAFDLYEALNADNSRTFWDEHKHEYQSFVRDPLLALGDVLGPEFGEAHLYRPYRDLRFTKDKTPYKDHQGMFVESENGLGWYLQLSEAGVLVAGGWYMSDPVQLKRYRQSLDNNRSANKLRGFLLGVEESGFEVSGDRLKTKPRGVAADHPNLDLLKYKSIYAHRTYEPDLWMDESTAADRIASDWRALAPWMKWQEKLVGPGQPPLGSRGGKGRTDTH